MSSGSDELRADLKEALDSGDINLAMYLKEMNS